HWYNARIAGEFPRKSRSATVVEGGGNSAAGSPPPPHQRRTGAGFITGGRGNRSATAVDGNLGGAKWGGRSSTAWSEVGEPTRDLRRAPPHRGRGGMWSGWPVGAQREAHDLTAVGFVWVVRSDGQRPRSSLRRCHFSSWRCMKPPDDGAEPPRLRWAGRPLRGPEIARSTPASMATKPSTPSQTNSVATPPTRPPRPARNRTIPSTRRRTEGRGLSASVFASLGSSERSCCSICWSMRCSYSERGIGPPVSRRTTCFRRCRYQDMSPRFVAVVERRCRWSPVG